MISIFFAYFNFFSILISSIIAILAIQKTITKPFIKDCPVAIYGHLESYYHTSCALPPIDYYARHQRTTPKAICLFVGETPQNSQVRKELQCEVQ